MTTTIFFNEITLDWWFNDNPGAVSPPNSIDFGLLMDEPSVDGTGIVEPSDALYARQAVDFTAALNDSIAWVTAPEFDVDDFYNPWGWGYWDDANNLLAFGEWSDTISVSSPTWSPPDGQVRIR